MTDVLLTSAQVAAVLGTSVRTVQRMVKDGKLKVASRGDRGCYLFDPETIRGQR